MSKIITNQIQHTQNGAQVFTLPTSDGSTGQLMKTDGSGALSFTDAGIDGVTTGSGNVTITDGDLIIANGHGIDFNATANAIPGQFNPPRTTNPTTDSELFHDYEYGTWNPVVWTSNGATNATMNTIGGHYVKVGRLVYLTFYCNWSNASNHGNYIYFNGFPFLSASNTGQDYNYGMGSCQINGFSFGNGGPQLHQGEASTGCNLVSNVSGGNSQNDGPTNTGMVIGNIQYIASY